MQLIKNAEFTKSSASVGDCPETDRPEYAFIGRSNVGKSSLINLLTNRKKLAKVSTKPGKTQLINHFSIDDRWFLVDLPGYGWAKVSKAEKIKWKRMIDDYIFQRENLINLFILVDSRHEPQKIDLEFMNRMGQAGIPFSIIFTKIDKTGKNQVQSKITGFKKVLSNYWEELPPLFKSSIVSGEGVEEILKYILDLNEQVKS